MADTILSAGNVESAAARRALKNLNKRIVAVRTRIEPADSALPEAAELIRSGELVAFPTETVYGLGGDAGNPVAIKRIYDVKGRPANNPLIVHVPDIAAAQECCVAFPALAMVLAKTFWPGPLTLVLQRGDHICPAVSAGKDTVAMRCPNHPIAQALLRSCGRPIAAPSANTSGHTSPTTAQHVYDELAGRIGLILNGGPCAVGLESTVVDATGMYPVILRPGAVTPAMLGQCLAGAGMAMAVGISPALAENPGSDNLKSPGLLESHYAPRTEAYRFYASDLRGFNEYLRRISNKRIGLLCFEDFAVGAPIWQNRILPSSAEACATVLYSALRELDAMQCDVLLVQFPENADGVWLAIQDRLRRATKELPP